jgi:hypothetical protein
MTTRNLPDHTRRIMHQLFWKLDLARGVGVRNGKFVNLHLPDVYRTLGEIDISLQHTELNENEDDIWFFHPDQLSPEVIWPVNKSILAGVDSEKGWPDGTLQITRVTTITPKIARTLGCKIFSKYLIRRTTCFLMPNQEADYMIDVFAWLGDTWVIAKDRKRWQGVIGASPVHRSLASEDDDHGQINTMLSMALRDRYDRHAIITSPNGLSVKLAMQPNVAMDFFRLRDVPPDKQRRSALRNWVRQHVRQISEDKTTDVRKHLRNRIQFTWRGFDCEYRPSAYEEEENRRLKLEKEAR